MSASPREMAALCLVVKFVLQLKAVVPRSPTEFPTDITYNKLLCRVSHTLSRLYSPFRVSQGTLRLFYLTIPDPKVMALYYFHWSQEHQLFFHDFGDSS